MGLEVRSGRPAVSLMVLAAVVPGSAAADDDASPEADPTYFTECGSLFQLPAWGDGEGWGGPSRYATIQLADISGRAAHEVQIQRFDMSMGQWRPQVDAQGNRIARDARTFGLPLRVPDTAGDRLCTRADAVAAGARTQRQRICTQIVAATSTRFSG